MCSYWAKPDKALALQKALKTTPEAAASTRAITRDRHVPLRRRLAGRTIERCIDQLGLRGAARKPCGTRRQETEPDAPSVRVFQAAANWKKHTRASLGHDGRSKHAPVWIPWWSGSGGAIAAACCRICGGVWRACELKICRPKAAAFPYTSAASKTAPTCVRTWSHRNPAIARLHKQLYFDSWVAIRRLNTADTVAAWVMWARLSVPGRIGNGRGYRSADRNPVARPACTTHRAGIAGLPASRFAEHRICRATQSRIELLAQASRLRRSCNRIPFDSLIPT